MIKAFPDEVIKIDLTTDQIVDVIHNEQLRIFYDISPDGKLAAYSVGIKTEENNSYRIEYKTEVIDTETGQVRETLEGKVQFVKEVSGEVSWQVITYGEEDKPTLPCDLHSNLELIDIPNSKDKLVLTNPLQVLEVSTCTVKKQQGFPQADPILLRYYYFNANGDKLVIPAYGSNSVLDIQTGEFLYSNIVWWDIYWEIYTHMGLNLDGSRMVLGRQEIIPGSYSFDSSRFVRYTLEGIDTTTGKVLWDRKPTGSKLEKILPGMDISSMIVEDDLGLHVWNLDNGKEVRTIPGATGLYSYPDGQQYIFVSNNQIHVWDAENWKDMRAFDGGELYYARAISPISEQGRIAILYTLGENPGKDMRVAVFDIRSGKKIFEVADDEGGLELMKDQPHFIYNREDGYIELWSTDQNTPINTFLGGHVINDEISGDYSRNYRDVFLSSDARIFITSNNGLEFWDVKSGDLLAKIMDKSNPLFSPDGRILVTTGNDGTFWVWGVKRE